MKKYFDFNNDALIREYVNVIEVNFTLFSCDYGRFQYSKLRFDCLLFDLNQNSTKSSPSKILIDAKILRNAPTSIIDCCYFKLRWQKDLNLLQKYRFTKSSIATEKNYADQCECHILAR